MLIIYDYIREDVIYNRKIKQMLHDLIRLSFDSVVDFSTKKEDGKEVITSIHFHLKLDDIKLKKTVDKNMYMLEPMISNGFITRTICKEVNLLSLSIPYNEIINMSGRYEAVLLVIHYWIKSVMVDHLFKNTQ